MSTPGPQEFPEGGGRGGGGRIRRPGHINELPAFDNRRSFQAVLLHEVLQLRDRMHSVESGLLSGRVGLGAAAVYNPAEFPEGGEGGEIVEIADIGEIVEIADIAEFQPARNLVSELATIREQLVSFEQRITSQITELQQQISKQ
jgi:hypothetical protein